ncbi:HAD family phosphatase [Mycolicibacterium sp. HK-90]|uniref:HAD family hydrolase n=1 Tax=Mycolicibacterium sp. HK-90 TaxID=3056937 RepID=UPI002657D8F9|nr:HAD family phosphatase [Mycolicibacterium sp. HK-90]WKG03919.1 HAD family phosphatase [Mycolicibacterium sp. HK-90]
MTTVITASRPSDLEPDADVRALLFGWDGTLFDTPDFNYSVLHKTLAAHGAAIDQRWFDEHRDLPIVDLVTRACKRSSVTADPHTIITQRNRLAERSSTRVRPNTLLHNVIHKHHRALPVGVVTGSDRATVHTAMRAFRLDVTVSVAVTRDAVIRGMPHPDGHLLACRRLGLPPTVVQVYEATDNGIRAARAAGVAQIVDVRPLLRSTRPVSHDPAHLLDFARRWEPYGGPPAEDIMIQFGLTPRAFTERVAQMR